MSRPRQTFAVGDVITGLRIVEEIERKTDPFWIMRTQPSDRVAYRVVCVQCGFESTIGYRAMAERVRSGRHHCRSCSGLKQRAERSRDVVVTDPALAVALGAWR